MLAGVGADSTNVGALGPRYEDGAFEYVPIPEKTRATSETETFGSWPLRYADGVAADLTTRLWPRPVRDPDLTVSGAELATWPVHRDPNFAALTYGEHRTSGGYVDRLRRLEPGDVVAFYAGLRGPDGDRAHRYLIGYVTVNEVATVRPDAPADERDRLLRRHADNAHAKRARDGDLYLEKPVVIVDGRPPGGLFERHPIRISDYYVKPGNERAQYYLRDEVASALSIVEGGANMTYKPAYLSDLEGAAFREAVGIPGERSSADGIAPG